MILSLIDFTVLGFTSFFLTWVSTPLMRIIAMNLDFVDKPNLDRKTQELPVPYLGGIAISASISLTTYFAILFSSYTHKTFWLATSVLIPALLMAIVGLVDDLIMMSPETKLATQFFSAVGVSGVLIVTKTSSLVDFSRIAGVIVTIIWVVGLINAVNLIDNHDGVSTSTVSISNFFTFLVSIYTKQYFISALALVVCASTLAFYFWNKNPAKIYMGDSGALYLGALLATITIRIKPAELPIVKSIFLVVMLVSIFILDSGVAITSRILRGKSPMIGGKDHLSHRLMRCGYTKTSTTLTLQAITGLFGAFAISTLLTGSWLVIGLYILCFSILFKVFHSISHED